MTASAIQGSNPAVLARAAGGAAPAPQGPSAGSKVQLPSPAAADGDGDHGIEPPTPSTHGPTGRILNRLG